MSSSENEEKSLSEERRKFLKKVALIGTAGASAVLAQSVLHIPPEVRATTTDQLVKVDASDTTADFLNSKLNTGIGISKSIVNPGANEQLNIAASSSSLVVPASRVVWRDATNTYVKDGTTGVVTSYSGSARDSNAIQGAIDAISNSQNGGMIFLREASYSISTTITLRSQISLVGEGHWKSVLTPSNNSVTILKNAAFGQPSLRDGQIEIHSLHIDGNVRTFGSGTANLVDIDGVTSLHIIGCTIRQSPNIGVQIKRASLLQLHHNRLIEAVAQTLTLTGVGDSFISHNDIGSTGPNIITGAAPADAVSMDAFSSSLFDHNNVYLGRDGIHLTSSSGASQLNRFVGNRINDNSRYGILFSWGTLSALDSNTVLTSGADGIRLEGSCLNPIMGNTVINSGMTTSGNGITLNDLTGIGPSCNNTIIGSIATDNQGTKTQQRGIVETGTANYNDITGNFSRGNVLSGIIVVGANTVNIANVV